MYNNNKNPDNKIDYERLEQLALPKYIAIKYDLREHEIWCTGVQRTALIGPIAERIDQLAMPNQRYFKDNNKKKIQNPFNVKRNALFAKTTERIQILSKPNARYLIKDNYKDPYKVKSGALKFIISKRIKRLSRPKYPIKINENYWIEHNKRIRKREFKEFYKNLVKSKANQYEINQLLQQYYREFGENFNPYK